MGVVSMRNQCESVMETGTNLSLVAFKQGVAMASFQPIVPKLKHKLFFFHSFRDSQKSRHDKNVKYYRFISLARLPLSSLCGPTSCL